MPQPVTDFSASRIEMTQQQFHALPQRVQDLLQLYGTQEPQGWGKPVIIAVPSYCIAELEAGMREAAK